MNKMKHTSRLLFYLLGIAVCSFLPCRATARYVREISVSHDRPFTDHLSLSDDSRDMDIMVKFIFNEEDNTLTVTLLSYRCLFVFHNGTRYKTVIHHNRLIPDMLPYVVTFPENSRFKLSKEFRKSIPKPNKEYIFQNWIDYRGLQPVPTDYKMVNDYIEQKYDIINYGNKASVRLREIIVMERKTDDKRHPDDYEFVARKDLDTEYHVTFRRNPCFGIGDEIRIASDSRDAIAKAYRNFIKRYSPTVESERALNVFNEMKEVLMKQFPHKPENHACPELKAVWMEYNTYADSISSYSCKLVAKEAAEGFAANTDPHKLYMLTRQIDRAVSRWLMSTDAVEKRDLVIQCRNIISEARFLIGNGRGGNAEQRKAIETYRQAENFFSTVCMNDTLK